MCNKKYTGYVLNLIVTIFPSVLGLMINSEILVYVQNIFYVQNIHKYAGTKLLSIS